MVTLYSCNKKAHPSSSKNNSTDTVTVVKKKPVRKKGPVPKVITVNDLVAHKTVDGRYYYDLEGRRYWRNNKDGKYYLYNRSMYNDPAFKGQD